MKNTFFLFLLCTLFSFAFIPSMDWVPEIKSDVVDNNSEFYKQTQIFSQYVAPANIYTEDFEGSNGWIMVNGTQENKWFVGTAVNNGGAKSLYISDNNGATNHYNATVANLSHAYRDIVIPANTTDVELSFDWRSVGDQWEDFFSVWIIPTSFPLTPESHILPDENTIQVGGAFNGQSDWVNYNTVVDLSSYAGQTMRLVFQWTNGGWVESQTPAAIDNITLKTISCSAPGNIQSENITTTTAEILWTAPGATNIESYDYYISETNSITQTTVPTGNVTTASVNLENLTPTTQYYFWVRSNCGTVDGQSSWTGPFVFSTACMILNLPFIETFNSDSSTLSCWSVINNNNDVAEWSVNNNFSPFEGDQSAYIQIASWIPIVNDDYIVSPVFNFNGVYRLRYYYKVAWGMVPQAFSVKMSQNGGTGVADFTETILAEQGYSNTEYIEKIVYLPAFTGQGAITWYVGNSNTREIFIDKVVIEPVPACPEPYELINTQVTDESVNITWQQFGPATSWEVIILPHGQTIPDDLTTVTVYQTNTNAITINGIEDSTDYDIYVRAVCSASDLSEWSAVLKVTTAPSNDNCEDAITLPTNPGPECVESISGTVKAATPSGIGDFCGTNPYNDVWYEFTAINTNHLVKLETEQLETTFITAYEDNICNDDSLIPLACAQLNSLNLTGLTIGNTYKIRVNTSQYNPDVNFNICVLTPAPVIVTSDTQYTVPELVTDVLINNPCVTISNISWSTGTNFNDVNGIGYFNKSNSTFSFKEGVLLSSGNIHLAPGPAAGYIDSGQMYNWPGDDQLTTYMNNYLDQPNGVYHNASVLEFDFVAITDLLKFNFIFASNEYGLYQCSYSDAFAFFLTNTETGVTTNLAVVPDTNDPISVVTIRKGIHSPSSWEGCNDVNPEYFDTLYNDQFNGENPFLSPINFYGLTIPMVAESEVVPGTTYHIKLVIQDLDDAGRDSAVFLEAGSFDFGSVDFGDDLLIENGNALCAGDSYIIDSELNPEEYTIQWYKDNVLISGANGSTLEVNQSGEYRIEATYIGSTCIITDTIKVEIYPEIKIVPPQNIEVCVFNQTMSTADLTIIENEMLSLISALSNIEVTYYETFTEAELEEDTIITPENYLTSALPKEIFVRIDDNKTGCHRIVSFKLVKKEVVDLKNPEKIEICVYDGVPVSLDLTTVRPGIVSQLANPNVILYYYETYENAIDKTGAITSPQNYQPDTLPTTIYIRFTDTATGCELMTSVEIVASPKITPIEMEDIIICNKYVLPELPEGYYYSTEEFGRGEMVKSGAIYNFGSYKIYLNIQNADGCVFSSSYDIEVIDCSIPKGISPNGDQLNDSFNLAYYHALEVVIYNRFGQEVYAHGSGYTNQWYGQNKQDKPLPDGTYFYKITTATEVFTGYVQLVREIK